MFNRVLPLFGKKHLLAVLFLTGLFVFISLAEADITIPGQGVWLFDQDMDETTVDDSSVHDSSVYRNNGTRMGGVTASTDTPFDYSGNNAAAFDGIDGYISIPAGDSLLVGESATVECWIKFLSGALLTGTHQIVGGADYNNNFLISQSENDLLIYWKSDVPIITLPDLLIENVWTHIAVTVSQGTVSVYLNGELQDSQSTGNNTFTLGKVNIGGNEYYSGWNISGLVDEVRILDYPLTQSNIIANYQASLRKEHAFPGLDRKLAMYQTEFSPAVLLHSTDKSIRLFQDMDAFGLGAPTHISTVSTVNDTGVVSVYQFGAGSIPADIAESWLLVWFKGGTGWDDIQFIQKPAAFSGTANPNDVEIVESPEPVGEFDVPWLIVLQHRPSSISGGPSGMELTFENSSVGYVRMMPLYGIKRLDPAETNAWSGDFPSEVVQRSRRWASILQMYPIEIRETFSVDHETDRINIRDEFEYLRIEDDWGTEPTLVAPIPPTLGLIYRYAGDDNPAGNGNHLVSFDQTPLDEEYMTPYGPLYVTEMNHKIEFSLKDQLKYANGVAYVTGNSNFDADTLADLKTRLADAVDSQYIQHYNSRAGNYPTVCYDNEGNPIEYTYSCYNSSGQRIIYYGSWLEWEAFDWMRLGLTSSAIAKARPYLEVDQKNTVDELLNQVLDEYLNRDNYIEFRDDIRGIDYLIHEHRWNYNGGWADAHGYGGTLHSMYVLASELGRMDDIAANWEMVRKIWNGVQHQQWINFPAVTQGDFLHSMIAGSWAMARMAAHIGDQENYDLGVYSGARFLLNRYATIRAIDYANEMGQWAHWMDPDRDYFYFSTRSGDLDRLKWAQNTMGFKFFDTEITKAYGWEHTFIIRLYEENFDRFFHEKALTTAGPLSDLIDANRRTEEKLINGVTTTSTFKGHWETVGWKRDYRGLQVEVNIELKDPFGGTSPVQDVSQVDIRSLSTTGHGVYYPSNFEVFYEDEYGQWQLFGSTSPDEEGVVDNGDQGAWHTFTVTSAQPVTTGYLKLKTTLYSKWDNVLSNWFTDEIEVFRSNDEKIMVESISATPPANWDLRTQDWFALENILTPLTKEEIYNQLLDIHGPDTPLVDNIWRTLHAGEGWPFKSIEPSGFVNNIYWPGLDKIRNETRSVGVTWLNDSYKNRLEHARSSYAMLSKNYWDVSTPGWPLLSWYGFIAPQAPQDAELQNLLPFGFVKPAANVSPSWLTARIIRSSNLVGVYTVGDVLAEWPLNAGEGLKLHEISDNGNDIFLAEGEVRNPSWYEEKPGQFVMEFNKAEDDVITFPGNDLFVLENNGYIESWVKFRSLEDVTHQIVGGRDYQQSFMLNQSGKNLYAYWMSPSPTIKLNDVFLEINTWYRVAIANNYGIITARVDKLGDDGSITLVVPESVYPSEAVDIGDTIFTKKEINIGGRRGSEWTGDNSKTLDGYIRDVKICSSSRCIYGQDDRCTDNDGDGVATEGGICGPEDCNDSDPEINPGAGEICDGIDNNCDGSVDEGYDTDNDGYTTCGGDCNDSNSDINPAAEEICNDVDDNCDGNIDEGDVCFSDITATPVSKDFGSVAVGSVSAVQTFTITNSGTADLVIGETYRTGSNPWQFIKLNDTCKGQTIAPSASCTIDAQYVPTKTGTMYAKIGINSNDPDTSTLYVNLIGTGIVPTPDISAAPASKDFGTVVVGNVSSPQIFTISNDGTADLVTGGVYLTGSNPYQFSILNEDCSERTIAPLGTCTIEAQYKPTKTGTMNANIGVESNDPDTPKLYIDLTGTGI